MGVGFNEPKDISRRSLFTSFYGHSPKVLITLAIQSNNSSQCHTQKRLMRQPPSWGMARPVIVSAAGLQSRAIRSGAMPIRFV